MKRVWHRGRAWLLTIALCLLAIVVVADVLSSALWPEAPGEVVYEQGNLVVDASNAGDGYVMAHGGEGGKPFKLRVSKDGASLLYDINNSGENEVFPLQLSSGEYTFELFQNVNGKGYANAGSLKFSVDLQDENRVFLYPNQYVNYGPDSEAVAISQQICDGLTTDKEKLEAVRQYVLENFTYDQKKASTIKSGVLPSIEYLLENRMGICQDLAAFVACTLRVQGIPTQMVIGYIGKYYHAWNAVLIDGEYLLVDLTAELTNIPNDMPYTVERIY